MVFLKRETRFELAALALARRCSTTELSGQGNRVPETGIEPVRVLPRRILSPVRLPVPPLGLKPFPFIYFAIS